MRWRDSARACAAKVRSSRSSDVSIPQPLTPDQPPAPMPAPAPSPGDIPPVKPVPIDPAARAVGQVDQSHVDQSHNEDR